MITKRKTCATPIHISCSCAAYHLAARRHT